MLRKCALLLAIAGITSNAWSADDSAKVERLGMQAYASLLCWPEGASDDLNIKHLNYFKRKSAELISILDATPERQRKLYAENLPVGLIAAYTYRNESVDFRQGFMLANAVQLIVHRRAQGASADADVGGYEAKVRCSTLDLDT